MVHRIKPTTAQAKKQKNARSLEEKTVGSIQRDHTNVDDPPYTDRRDEASVAKALHPQGEGESTPGANEKLGAFPEEDRDSTAGCSGDGTREDKHSAKGFTGWIDGGEHSELEDEDETD
jgi:hypothetical protein